MNRARWILALSLALGGGLLFAADSSASLITSAALRKQSDSELLKTYQTSALAAGATDALLDMGNPADRDGNTVTIKAEMLRRGDRLVPQLLSMLRAEIALRRPTPAGSFATPSLAGGEIQLLVEMGDPRAVPTLLDVVSAPLAPKGGGPGDPRVRALEAIEKLTFACFHQVKPFTSDGSDVQQSNALKSDSYSLDDMPKTVQLYRDWLAGEGKDPAQWLPLAQQRAGKLLESDDLNVVFCAAEFLSGAGRRGLHVFPHDDAPDRTVRRLGQIVAALTCDSSTGQLIYKYQGRPLSQPVYNWVNLLCSYGPRARPWSDALIRIQKEFGINNWGGLQEIGKVGGPKIMAYFFEVLPVIDKQVQKIRSDPNMPKGFSSGDPRGWWFDSQGECRGGIDRWAGRGFDSDELRLAWWKANRGKSPERWLRDSLPIAVERANAGNRPGGDDVWLFHQLLPDAPHGNDEFIPFSPAGLALDTVPQPFAQKWFDQHRADLRYDANAGAFRLPK